MVNLQNMIKEVNSFPAATVKTVTLTDTRQGNRTIHSPATPTPPPHPPKVHKVGYQCQMLYRTGVHHLLTCLNKASRSTRCNDNNNISLSALTRSSFGQCTLDPVGSRVTNVNSRLSSCRIIHVKILAGNTKLSNHSPHRFVKEQTLFYFSCGWFY